MLSVEPKAEADNSCRDLDFWGYHQSRILYVFLLYIVFKKITPKTQSHETQFDIALGMS